MFFNLFLTIFAKTRQMAKEQLTVGRKPLGDKKKVQITFYIEQYVEDVIGRAECKDICQKVLYAEYESKSKKKK